MPVGIYVEKSCVIQQSQEGCENGLFSPQRQCTWKDELTRNASSWYIAMEALTMVRSKPKRRMIINGERRLHFLKD